VDESTLDWEQYLPALQFSYNTSYHSTISTTPFELLYGMKPRTPSIPGQDVQRVFYGESFASERLQILQKARQIAKENISEKQKQYKEQHDKTAKDHKFSIGQKVWYLETNFLGRNKKLAPKYCGPATIIDVNESVAKIKTEKNKLKTITVNKLKLFQDSEADATTEAEADTKTDADKSDQDLIKFDPSMCRPFTRAWSKLIKSDAISALITKTDAASSEEIWYKLNSIAYKLYHLNLEFNQLTSEELRITQSISAFAQQLWNNNRFYNSTNRFNNRSHLPNRDLLLQIQFRDQVRESQVDRQAPKTKQRTRFREQRTPHLKGSLEQLPKSSHRTPLERMQMHLSNILLLFFAMGGVQTRPLFDFLPPVIIDENQ